MNLQKETLSKPSIGSRIARLAVRTYLAPAFTAASRVEKTRRRLETISALALLPRGTTVKKIEIDGMNAEWVVAHRVSRASEKAVLYLHGGGFFAGSPATHRELAARISKASGLPVLVPEYRLAPEHKYPAANQDCLAAYHWMLHNGYFSDKIVIGGDSAGGCLTLMTILSLRDAGEPLPAAAVLISPLTDAVHADGESLKTRAEADPLFQPDAIGPHMQRYFGGIDPAPAILSPVRQNLTGLPPMLIQVGSDEVLLNDSTRLAERATQAGVNVTLEVWEDMFHVFQTFAVIIPEARRAIYRIGAFIREHLNHSPVVEEPDDSSREG
jgi:monoterpene epsilon-lactone hydrolase